MSQAGSVAAVGSRSDVRTINAMFRETAARLRDRPALRRKVQGVWKDVSWTDFRRAAAEVGLGLRALGLEKGSRVALLSSTRVEWSMTDLGVLGAGGVSVPIYQSNPAKDCAYIIADSEAEFIFCENAEQAKKVLDSRADVPSLKKVILFEGTIEQAKLDPGFGMTFDALRELGRKETLDRFEALADEATPDDLLTLVYTSGTTGPPKGVMLTHRSIGSECDSLNQALPLPEEEITIAYLPLAHIFARVLQFAAIRTGFITCYAESMEKLKENLGETSPTFVAAVPRVLEKFHGAVMTKINAKSGLGKKLALWSVARGRNMVKRRQAGQATGGIRDAIASSILGKVRAGLMQTLGGRIKFFISGGAPLSREIHEFFDSLGILILEGFGLTETTAGSFLNRRERYKIGTVGKAVPGIECKIAADGEILLRGAPVMKGYYKKEEATREALEPDGWFHTGDIGEMDAEGFLRITDRKKDLIVTAAGKNVAPQNIENHVKTDTYISQVMVYGDKRKFLSALVTLKKDVVDAWARERGLSYPTWEALAGSEEVRKLIHGRLELKNEELAQYEKIKKFVVLAQDFSQETGELTPTLKVKRKFCNAKFKAQLDALYDEKFD